MTVLRKGELERKSRLSRSMTELWKRVDAKRRKENPYSPYVVRELEYELEEAHAEIGRLHERVRAQAEALDTMYRDSGYREKE